MPTPETIFYCLNCTDDRIQTNTDVLTEDTCVYLSAAALCRSVTRCRCGWYRSSDVSSASQADVSSRSTTGSTSSSSARPWSRGWFRENSAVAARRRSTSWMSQESSDPYICAQKTRCTAHQNNASFTRAALCIIAAVGWATRNRRPVGWYLTAFTAHAGYIFHFKKTKVSLKGLD